MKETFARENNVATLEDLIRLHPQKPNKELLCGVARAREVIDEFSLNDMLGISGVDSIIFHAFFAERIIKTRIYDFDWITHSPEFVFSPKDIARDNKNRAILQESLDRLIVRRDEMILQSYTDKNQRLRARSLELAANDLVARSTSFDEKSFTNFIIVSDELVAVWAQKWEKELGGDIKF